MKFRWYNKWKSYSKENAEEDSDLRGTEKRRLGEGEGSGKKVW